MLQLITDRNENDIIRAKSLIEKAKKLENLTNEELAEYNAGLRGCYNITDLNRVESAVQYLSDLLNDLGYSNTVNTKTWEYGDLFDSNELTRYLNNILNLKNAYYVKSDTPLVPSSYKPYNKANDIEKILLDIEDIIIIMQNNFRKCGVAKCGQSYMWQQRFRSY